MKEIIISALLISSTFIRAQTPEYDWDWAHTCKGLINPKIEVLQDNLYLTATFKGSCVVNGETISSSHPVGGFVAQLTTAGTVQWSTIFGASELSTVDIHSYNSNIYIAGSFEGTISGYAFSEQSSGGSDIFVLKLGQTGNVEMSKRDGSVVDEHLVDFAVDSSVVLVGQYQKDAVISGVALNGKTAGNNNVFFARYERLNGNNIWVQDIFGPTGSEAAQAFRLVLDEDRDVYIKLRLPGMMNVADTVEGFCTCCLPVIRFRGSDGTFVGNVADTETGDCNGNLENVDIAADKQSNIYVLGNFEYKSIGRTPQLSKYVNDGTHTYSKFLIDENPQQGQGGTSGALRLYTRNNEIFYAGASSGNNQFAGTNDTLSGSWMFVAHLDENANYKRIGKVAKLSLNTAPLIDDIAINSENQFYITGKLTSKMMFGTTTLDNNNVSDIQYIAKTKTGSPLSVKEITKANVLIYPNPTKGVFNIKPDAGTELHVSIYNVIGECIYSKKHSPQDNFIDITGAQPGCYFVQIANDNLNQQLKLIIQ
jgi:hypothetical protein